MGFDAIFPPEEEGFEIKEFFTPSWEVCKHL